MNTTSHPTPREIALGPPGATETIDRIVAGAPITLTWPGDDAPLRAFLAKAIAWSYEPAITVGELYNLVYGDQNPLLEVDHATGHAVVTRRAHEDPAWALLNELIDRKRVAEGHLEPAQAAARFDMTVTQAAAALERTPSAIRQLIASGRLVARKEGSSYLLDRACVEAFRGLRRGPRSIAKAAAELAGNATEDGDEDEKPDAARVAPARGDEASAVDQVQVRVGHEKGHHVRIKGAAIASPDTSVQGVLSGALEPGWTRLHVLAYGDDGRARLFVFEPAPGASTAWRFAGFYLRGALREVERDNNPTRARERFDALPKD